MTDALLLIDAQRGFLEPYWGPRNNPEAERNQRRLLDAFRSAGGCVIHVHHWSRERASPLRPGQRGVEPIDGLGPIAGERVFRKDVNSAFIGTGLEAYLRAEGVQSLALAGFTSDHCVSTSTRMAANLGFTVSVVGDATAAFDRKLGAETFSASLVHAVSLASLSGEFARIVAVADFID